MPTATAPTAVRGAGPASGELSHRQILTILAGLMLGMFLAALDQTVVSTAIRTIADDLGGLDQQAWATTAFLITSTITTPLYGKLSDLYGRKPFFLLAIAVFIVGSVTCTLAGSMYQLAAFRALQGIGAGGLFSLALTILGDIVPPRERARYQGYFLAVFGTSSVLGPVIGGLLSGTPVILGIDGWRWIFLVNVPIGAVALVVVARVLNIPHVRRNNPRIDWPGAVLLAVGLVPLLIVAEQGRTWGWGSVEALTSYVVGAVGLLLFVLVERRYGDDALLPLRLFRNGSFALITVIGVIVGMGMFGGIALLPQFLQIVHGATPIQSGFLMLPLVAGIMTASVVSGQLTARTGRYKVFPVVGTLVMTGAMLVMWLRVSVDIPLWELDLYMAAFGLGLGSCMQTLVLAAQTASPARDMGVATASTTFFRQLGGTLGTAIFLSVVFSTVGDKIKAAFASAAGDPAFQAAVHDPAVLANPADAKIIAGLQSGSATASSGVLTDSSFLQQIDPRLARPFLVGFSQSITLTFALVAALIGIAFLMMLFVRELPLRTMSGARAAALEEAGAAAAASAGGPAAPGSDAKPAPDGPGVSGERVDGSDASGARAGAQAAHGPGAGVPMDGTRGRHARATRPLAATAATGPAERGRATAGTAGTGSAATDATAIGPDGPEAFGIAATGTATGPVPTGTAATGTAATGTAATGTAATGTVAAGPAAGVVGGTGPTATGPTTTGPAATGPGNRPVGGPELAGTVTGAGAGLAGAVVTVANQTGRQLARAAADGTGHYRARLAAEGTYLVVVAADGFSPQAGLVPVVAGGAPFDVMLAGANAVHGTVSGPGAVGALVTLRGPDGVTVASGTVDPSGTYRLSGVPDGGYTVAVAVPGQEPVTAPVAVGGGATVRQDVLLPGRSRLLGTVTAASSGRGVAEAVATLVDPAGAVVGSVVTAPDGTFAFEDLPAGTYTLTARGYAPVAQRVRVTPGTPASATVALGAEPVPGPEPVSPTAGAVDGSEPPRVEV